MKRIDRLTDIVLGILILITALGAILGWFGQDSEPVYYSGAALSGGR